MQTVVLGPWGDVTFYASGDSLPLQPGLALPDNLRHNDRFRPALLHVSRTDSLLPYIAVWPERSHLPDARDSAAPWTLEELSGVMLTEWGRGWRCRVCDGRVDALQAATLPFFSDQLRHHQWATHCPHCRAHVDRAKLHAAMIWPADRSPIRSTEP
ncbi:hypothetical protein [Streptomyces sp. NPDC050149]|uniref:hypothetical protein n=1 Tax=unclassified Streptomyces TaxID=2593676 RepID=UPI00379959B3